MRRARKYLPLLATAVVALVVMGARGAFAGGVSQAEAAVFLPVVVRGDEQSGNAVANGDFEAGRTAWTESSTWGNVLIVADQDLPAGVSSHNGAWAAWLGGDNDEVAYIEQSVFVDPATSTLVYWYWLDWPEACQGATGAVMTVSLDLGVIEQSDVCATTDTGGWVRNAIDVSGFAGQARTLRFQITTKAQSYANVYVDDVSLQASP